MGAHKEQVTQYKRDQLPNKNRSKMTRGIQTESRLRVVDNSGAKEVKVIGVKRFQGKLNTLPCASPGDMVVASVKKGKPDLKKKVVLCVLIRQKKSWKRKDGSHIEFVDNACVLIDAKGELRGSQISGPVPREVAELWPKVASQATALV